MRLCNVCFDDKPVFLLKFVCKHAVCSDCSVAWADRCAFCREEVPRAPGALSLPDWAGSCLEVVSETDGTMHFCNRNRLTNSFCRRHGGLDGPVQQADMEHDDHGHPDMEDAEELLTQRDALRVQNEQMRVQWHAMQHHMALMQQRVTELDARSQLQEQQAQQSGIDQQTIRDLQAQLLELSVAQPRAATQSGDLAACVAESSAQAAMSATITANRRLLSLHRVARDLMADAVPIVSSTGPRRHALDDVLPLGWH